MDGYPKEQQDENINVFHENLDSWILVFKQTINKNLRTLQRLNNYNVLLKTKTLTSLLRVILLNSRDGSV